MFLRMPASCFPYAAHTGRLELDHTISYLSPSRGGPPGQTGVSKTRPDDPIRASGEDARPLAGAAARIRSLDLAITESWLLLVTNAGTYSLGDGPFARRVWRAAAPTGPPPALAA